MTTNKIIDYCVLTVCILVSTYFLLSEQESNHVIVYDCSIAEISPDYPIEVKEECRKIRAEHI
jgi:hypothetical protein